MKTNSGNILSVHLTNTLTGALESFVPIESGKVKMYTCGPTVYSRAHVGNLRAYICADVARRALEYAGYDVLQVMNITDVGHLTSDADEGEDKMQKAAYAERVTAWELSRKYTAQFQEDCAGLNIQPAHILCRATDHLREQIALIQRLEAKGYTYKTSDGIYFDTSRFPTYADFAKLDLEGLEAGKRIAIGEKRNKTDFALWKFSKPGERRDMEWESPWGTGFPGWHIECSAMSMQYLGETFDLHTGGIDHIPIHHTNEIAQSESATGRPFVKYWLHSDFLVLSDEEKMSKSLGNVITLGTLLDRSVNPLAYRLLCLNVHYRKRLLFGDDILQSAIRGYSNLTERVLALKEQQATEMPLQNLGSQASGYIENFRSALLDDFNTPRALGGMWNLIKDSDVPASEKLTVLLDFDRILALGMREMRKVEKDAVPGEVTELLNKRNELRSAKKWKEADEVRDTLVKLGYKIADTPNGSAVERL